MIRTEKINKIIEIANCEFNNYGYSEEFKSIQNLVIDKYKEHPENNMDLIISFYMGVEKANKNLIVDTVINSKRIMPIYNLALKAKV